MQDCIPVLSAVQGLVSIIKQGKIGNAKVGAGEWLVIEADESDGSIVQYKPEIGLLLNIDKDHKEIEVLLDIFSTFRNNRRCLLSIRPIFAQQLLANSGKDFSVESLAGYRATEFQQMDWPFLLRSMALISILSSWADIIWRMHWLLLRLPPIAGVPLRMCGRITQIRRNLSSSPGTGKKKGRMGN